jgi:hypothetical protein
MIAGAAAAAILAAVGLIHVYWAAGGRLGKGAGIPTENGKPVLQPSPLATAVVAAGLFGMAALLAVRIGGAAREYQDARFVRVGLWLMAAIFLVRAVGDFRYVGFLKRVRGGRFARLDTLAYSPLCLLLAVLIATCASA